MKKTYVAILLCAVAISLCFTSCKKEKDSGSGEVFASIKDTAGADIMTLTYNSDNRVSRAVANTTTYDLYYSGTRLIKRTLTTSGSLTATDSFFYDGAGRFSRVDNYNSGGTLAMSTVFSYNADNTVNTANVNSSTFGVADQMFEFTYTGGNINTIMEREKVLGNFEVRRKYDFLAYDNNNNPIKDVIKKYFPDQFNLLIFLWSSGNNFTSVVQTDYNVFNGSVTGTVPVSATYKYNAAGNPTEITSTINGNTNRNIYSYTSL